MNNSLTGPINRILVVGEVKYSYYEESFARALNQVAVQAEVFSTSHIANDLLIRIQLKVPFFSTLLKRWNESIIRFTINYKPDVVLFWRPVLIHPATITVLRGKGIHVASYNNDDPFGPMTHGNVPWHHHFLWYWYLKCLPYFDSNFFYRDINCAEAKVFHAERSSVLMPYFLPWKDRPVVLSKVDQERFETDIVFVGHYEPDGREESIRDLVNAGIKTKIWGCKEWSRLVLGDLYEQLAPIERAEGDDYAKALCGAKICLCFLSKLNRDTYTRRCFEIPACGRVLLAERTDDLLRLFKEDEEACFFSTNEELVEKACWLLRNPDIRERIAQAGLQRVWADGHDVTSRVRQFLAVLS